MIYERKEDMNLKKKLKAFFTLKRRQNGGFTLVELIVVIAILAILAGVGSAGYAGYIKNANKNSDKVLVGNIMRAIETGTNSTMFVNDDSFKLGKLSYPVGFVTLSSDPAKGASIVTSQTEMVEGASACEFVTATNVYTAIHENYTIACERKDTFLVWCGTTKSDVKATISGPSDIKYCKTHSNVTLLENQTKTYVTEISKLAHSGHTYTTTPTSITGNILETAPTDNLYLVSSTDSTKCEYAYANQYGSFGESVVGTATTGDPLYDSLAAAFGSDLSALTLSYDGWSSDEGIDYATIYNSAPKLMEDIEDLSGLLSIASQQNIIDLGLSQTYANSDEVLTGVSANVTAAFATEEAWMAQWNNDANMTWDSYGFGMLGRENYSAVRMAYNNAFASYLESKGETKHLDTIREFYSQSVNLVVAEIGLPGLICSDAFTDSASPLKSKITNEEEFEALHNLYNEYLESNAFLENGKTFYGILTTFDETSDVAYAYKDMNGGDIYDYYNNYVNEMNTLYAGAQAAAGEGIVIIVVVEDGELNFQISPSAANPRLDD